MTRTPEVGLALAGCMALLFHSGTLSAQEPAPPPPAAPPGTVPPPPPGPPPNAAPDARAPVRFDADEPGMRVFALGGVTPVERVVGYRYGWWVEQGIAPVYTPICRAPCSASLAPGQYELALAKPGRGAVPVREPVFIQGPSVIHGTYVDRLGLRIAGWTIGIAGSATGAALMAISSRGHEIDCDADGYCYRRVHYNGVLLGAGIGVAVASILVGAVLAAQRDTAHVTVEPLTPPPSGASGALRDTPRLADAWGTAAQGAALALHF